MGHQCRRAVSPIDEANRSATAVRSEVTEQAKNRDNADAAGYENDGVRLNPFQCETPVRRIQTHSSAHRHRSDAQREVSDSWMMKDNSVPSRGPEAMESG